MESRQKRIRQVFVNEFKILSNDKKTLAFFLLGPIIILVVLGAVTTVTGGAGLGGMEKLKVAVVDEDQSQLSQALVSRFQQSDRVVVVKSNTDRTTGMRLFEEGKVDVVYIIESGFDSKLRTYYLHLGSSDKATLDVVVDTSWVTPPSAAQAVAAEILLEFFQKDAFPAIVTLPSNQQVPADQVQQLIAVLAPIDARVQTPYGENPVFAILFPTLIPLMLISFSIQLSGLSIVGERIRGTLSRILKTPVTRSEIVIGKALAYVVVGFIQATGVVAVALIFGVSVKSGVIPLFAALFLTSYVACALGIFFSSFSTSEKAVIQLANITALLLNALGGAIIPLSNMPPTVQSVGQLLPIYNSVTALRAITIKGLGAEAYLPYLIYLAVSGTAALVLAVIAFRFTKTE
jgi:ABC-2 type transport system permease protein